MELDPATTEALVRRAQRQDAAAFAQLIRAFERTALSVAYSVLGDASDAGDAVQEGFLRAWQRLTELKEPTRFAGWLCGIIRNLAIDARRRRSRHDDWARSVADGPVGEVSDPSQDLSQREENQKLNVALDTLDEVSRSAIVLRYYEGLSSKEIGEMLGLAPAAVDMRLMRARRQLREKLEMPADEADGAARLA